MAASESQMGFRIFGRTWGGGEVKEEAGEKRKRRQVGRGGLRREGREGREEGEKEKGLEDFEAQGSSVWWRRK